MGKPRSDALAAVHETTAGLAKAGVITKQTMTSILSIGRSKTHSWLIQTRIEQSPP